MPPKPRKKSTTGGKKRKGKSGRKSAKPLLYAAGVQDMNELSVEFFMIQIKDLESRLAKFQQKCYELEISNKGVLEERDQVSADRREVGDFLKKQLQKRKDEIADLKDRLTGLQQQRDSEKESYEQQLQKMRNEFQEIKDSLTQENMILAGKLAALEEFKIQKEDLLRRLEEMEKELEKQEETHKEALYQLEKKAVIDKDRLKKEMVQRVNQVAAEFRKVSNRQMAETTKRTIRENVSISGQLTKMSDKTMELIQENDEMKLKNKEQRRQIDILETNEKELAKKCHSGQKMMEMLTERIREQEQLLGELDEQRNDYDDLADEKQQIEHELLATRTRLEAIESERSRLESEVTRVKQTNKSENQTMRKIKDVLGKAAVIIHSSVMDRALNASELTEEEQRYQLLQQLQILLNSAAYLGVGPQALDMSTSKTMGGSAASLGLAKSPAEIAKSLGEPLTSRSPLYHYKMGDLGLVPRPKPDPASEHTVRQLSASSRKELGVLRRIAATSIATQTDLLMSGPPMQNTSRQIQLALLKEIAAVKRETPLKTLQPIRRYPIVRDLTGS